MSSRVLKAARWGLLSATPYLPQPVRDRLVPAENQWSRADDSAVPQVGPADRTLLIGPLNTAGQAKRWADAAALLPEVASASLGVTRGNGPIRFPADAITSLNALRHSPTWSKRQLRALRSNFSHVLIESASPLLGTRLGRDLEREVEVLQEAGLEVGLVWHGSDIRRPSAHWATHNSSPFAADLGGLTDQLEGSTRKNAELADRLRLTEFASTPDLLDYRPNAVWLPTLHDAELWQPDKPGAEATRSHLPGRLPIVVHVPSRVALKGTASIREAMRHLDGVVEYRELQGLTPAQVVEAIREADIVLDQVGMGLYGVAALEGLSLGKPVIAEVGDSVRQRILDRMGFTVPLVEAQAETLAAVVADLAANSEQREQIGRAGRRYLSEVHNPNKVAQILDENFLRRDGAPRKKSAIQR
ncbi:glycosyltransferase [Actinomyces minihominis]|uniref:glycosyltransferase n=1 Tax=Actinomyces minihominis TaxID=2002838 RepID=UPI000C07C684|nr:glycosyltransferase [Actinomyces minihominis]